MNGALPSKTPAAAPHVRIVTINWNAHADTARLLQALRALTYPAFETVVVDNGSTDGSLEKLRAEFPEVHFLPLATNAGFGAANNAALRPALARAVPFAWLINNDARPEPAALEALIARMEADPRAGAAGCIVLDEAPPNGIQAWGGGHINPWLGYVRLNASAAEPLEFITGAALLLRTAALREAGLFDERFFLYWEDADLCFRLRKAGWRLTVAEARVHHKGSSTTGRNRRLRSFHSGRSLTLFMDKHERFPRLKSFAAIAFQSLGKLLRRNVPAAAGFWAGWRAGRAVDRRPDPATTDGRPTQRT